MSSKKKVGKKCRTAYSKGQLNKLVDCIFHPLYSENEVFRVVDGLFHGMVERDFFITTKKFLKYNLPALVRKASKRNK